MESKLIQCDLHLLEWYWHEVVEEDGPGVELRLAVWRNELVHQVRADGQFCARRQVSLR